MKIKTMFALAVTFLPTIGNAELYEGIVTTVQSPTETSPCIYFQLDTANQIWFSLKVEDNIAYREVSNMVLTARTYEKTIRVYTTGRLNPNCGYTEVNFVRY